MRAFVRVVLALFALGAFGPPAARAGPGHYEPTSPPNQRALPSGARGFYAEFRGRHEEGSFGHSYVVLGALDGAGRRHDTLTFGFMPKTADDERWALVAVPVDGLVGTTRSDFVVRPDVRYHVRIGRRAYRELVQKVRTNYATWQIYALVGQNCNDLVADAAQTLGLEVPLFTLQLPPDYVAELKALNHR